MQAPCGEREEARQPNRLRASEGLKELLVNDRVLTDEDEIRTALNAHWQDTFNEKPIREDRLEDELRTYDKKVPRGFRWKMKCKEDPRTATQEPLVPEAMRFSTTTGISKMKK